MILLFLVCLWVALVFVGVFFIFLTIMENIG